MYVVKEDKKEKKLIKQLTQLIQRKEEIVYR